MITKEDLINKGFKPKLCKIGTLYFNDPFFCILKDGKADIRTNSNDMRTFKIIENIDELSEVYLNYYKLLRANLQRRLDATNALISIYENKISGFISNK